MEKRAIFLFWFWTFAWFPGSNGAKGKCFLVMFPFTPFSECSVSITAVGDGPVTVTAKTVNGIDLNVTTLLGGSRNWSQRLIVSNGLVMNTSDKYSTLGIQVKADGDITVHTSSYALPGNRRTSMDTTLVLPLEQLSTEYVAFTSCLINHCFIAIGSPFDSVHVRVRLRIRNTSGTTNSLYYKSDLYKDGDNITEILNAYEAMQILSSMVDMTGTRIYSNHPVAVVSGGEFTRIENTRKDAAIEQIPPICSLGNQFVLTALPSIPTFIDVVFTESFTSLDYDNTKLLSKSRDNTGETFLLKTSPVVLSSNSSVLVFLIFGSGKKDHEFDLGLTLAMPTSIWTSRYTLTCVFNGIGGRTTESIVLYTCRGCEDFSFMDGITVWEPSYSWNVSGDYQVTSILIPRTFSGRLIIFSDICVFGGYVMGVRKALGWANPLGWDYTTWKKAKYPSQTRPQDSFRQQWCKVIPTSSYSSIFPDEETLRLSVSNHVPISSTAVYILPTPLPSLVPDDESTSRSISYQPYTDLDVTSPTPSHLTTSFTFTDESLQDDASVLTTDTSISYYSFSDNDIVDVSSDIYDTLSSSYMTHNTYFSHISLIYTSFVSSSSSSSSSTSSPLSSSSSLSSEVTPQSTSHLPHITASAFTFHQDISTLLTESPTILISTTRHIESKESFSNTHTTFPTLPTPIDTTDYSPVLPTTNTTPQPAKGSHVLRLCPCDCSKMKKTVGFNVTDAVEEQLKNEIQKELTVSKTSLSSTVRRKVSSTNTEESSTYLGSVIAVSVCMIVTAFIVGADAIQFFGIVYNFLQTLCGNR